MPQFIIITRKSVIRAEARSMAHVTQACNAVKLRPLSVTEVTEDDE